MKNISLYNSILIVGCGNIGKHICSELQTLRPDIYDPNIREYSKKKKVQYDFAFICVPTDSMPDGSCDISIVDLAVRDTEASIIVIKSAIPAGTAEMLKNRYRKHIVVSPEYYGTTRHAEKSPNFLVLGGDKKQCEKVAQLYYKVKNGNFRIKFTDYRTAELAKYMENCFLALKVTFCCEFAGIAQKYGISYPELREIFIADGRMGDSHTFVYPEAPYYNSHCLNKDIPALIAFAGRETAPLMSAADEINNEKKYAFKK